MKVDYELEELVPIVAWLSRQYTSGESTSVTYEKAGQLMEAVLYCIGMCGTERASVTAGNMSAEKAYHLGYEILIRKVTEAQEIYNKMIIDFKSYGNVNLRDTVTRALPGFFLYYDTRFSPQETIITMDYPTLRPITDKTGILAIEQYINDIKLEQEFMEAFPEAYVCCMLECFQRNYRTQFYNICSILLRHILGCMVIGKRPGRDSSAEDYKKLKQFLKSTNKEQITLKLEKCIDEIIHQKWENKPELSSYLKTDAGHFASDLLLGAENDCMERIVVTGRTAHWYQTKVRD